MKVSLLCSFGIVIRRWIPREWALEHALAEDQFSRESPFFFHSSLPHKQVNNYVFLFSFMMKFWFVDAIVWSHKSFIWYSTCAELPRENWSDFHKNMLILLWHISNKNLWEARQGGSTRVTIGWASLREWPQTPV
jgi:hypothetical protein